MKKWWIAIIAGLVSAILYEVLYAVVGKYLKRDWLVRLICAVVTMVAVCGGMSLIFS